MRGAVTLVGAALLALGTAACGDDGEEGTAPDETAASSDPSGEASTDEPRDGTTDGVFEVTFDGSGCTVAEPIEVVPGDYAFVLIDGSDLTSQTTPDPVAGEGATKPVTVAPRVKKMKDGHTFDDALAFQEESGGAGSDFRNPIWTNTAPFDPDPPALDLADNEQLFTAVLEPGGYYIGVLATTEPPSYWICLPVNVVAG